MSKDQRSLRVGTMVSGRYRIDRYIDRGGAGEVYEAVDTNLGEQVALKVLRADIAPSSDSAERFSREILISRRVTSPHVARLFDAGRHQGEDGTAQLYYTMEYLEGETLADRIARVGPLGEAEALALARQMADGLSTAHRRGVVHCDFKSQNVLLVSDPHFEGGIRAVVTDFGLAAAIDTGRDSQASVPTPGHLLGTPEFMAPEQVAEEELGVGTDIYAFGVVLFHMVTGRVPFVGEDSLSTAVRRLQRRPPAPSELRRGLHGRWDRVVLRCLERDPKDRFGSAPAAVRALTGSGSRLRWSGAAAAGAALLASLLVLLAWRWRAHQRDAVVSIGLDPVQWSSDPGLEIDPAYSPDGQLVAYASERSGRFEIYVRPLAPGGREILVTDDGGQNFEPAWSPDGSRLAFFSQVRGGIWVIPSRGGLARQLTRFGSNPVWSPDGAWLAFQEDGRDEVAERSVSALPPSTLWRVATAGGEPVRLTRPGEPVGGHGEPAFSSDGRWLAFTAGDRRHSDIWRLDLAEGGPAVRILANNRVNVDPVFSPRGDAIFWVGQSISQRQAAVYAVWRVGFDPETGTPRGEPQQIGNLGLGTLRHLAVHPTRDELAIGALTTTSDLWSLALDAEGRPLGPAEPLTSGRHRCSRPDFSPDGRSLVFDRWFVGTNLDLWILDLDRSALRQLTLDPEWDSQATWLQDGGIAFHSEREGRRALWRADPETGEVELLAELGVTDWATVSPDGRRVAFHDRRDDRVLNVWVRDLESGEERRLTEDPEMAGFPVWSRDGRQLAYEVRRGRHAQLALLDLEDPASARVVTDEEGEHWPFDFSPDGRRLAFAALRGRFWNLWWVDLETGEERRLTDLERVNAYVRYPTWSPAGDRLVFERAETLGDIWRLELATSNPKGAS